VLASKKSAEFTELPSKIPGFVFLARGREFRLPAPELESWVIHQNIHPESVDLERAVLLTLGRSWGHAHLDCRGLLVPLGARSYSTQSAFVESLSSLRYF